MSIDPTTPDVLPRRERERLARRQAILEAARAVFAERGYNHATLDEIAQRAEFGKGTLYNYFEGGKEGILFAVFDDLYDEMAEVLRQAFAPEQVHQRPFREVFEDFVAASFAFFFERQELFLLLMKEAYRMIFSEDRERAAYFKGQAERLVGTMVPALEAAMAAGELKPLPPHAVGHLILGNIEGLYMHVCLNLHASTRCEGALSLDAPAEAARFLTTLLLDGLHAQPQAEPSARRADAYHEPLA